VRIERTEDGRASSVWLSAATGLGVEELMDAISDRLSQQRISGWLTVSPQQGRLRAQLYAASAVLEEVAQDDGGVRLMLDIDSEEFSRLAREHDLKEESIVPDSEALAGDTLG